MAKKSYLPREDSKLVTWLQNLSSKIGTYATKYGISAAEVTLIQNAAAFFIFWYNALDQLKASTQNLTAFKNEIRDGVPAGGSASVTPTDILFGTPPTAVPPGILITIRSIVARIKKHTSYTNADGADLKIEGEDQTEDITNLKPEFKIVLQQGHPSLVWKKGFAEGVKIKVNRFMGNTPPPPMPPNQSDWQFLAIDTQPDYLDTAQLPPFGESVVWAYVMIYIIGDEEVGQWSDPVLVTVMGTP